MPYLRSGSADGGAGRTDRPRSLAVGLSGDGAEGGAAALATVSGSAASDAAAAARRWASVPFKRDFIGGSGRTTGVGASGRTLGTGGRGVRRLMRDGPAYGSDGIGQVGPVG